MKLLFVCTHNACRSILCEVIARDIGNGRIATASAGSNPAGRVHPSTLRQLDLHGYSSEGLESKGFSSVVSFAPDVVVTVCDWAARESCPVWLGDAVKAHWGLTDPSQLSASASEESEAFTQVIGTINARIEALLQHPIEALDKVRLAELFATIGEQSDGGI